jgi:hypothetical protein
MPLFPPKGTASCNILNHTLIYSISHLASIISNNHSFRLKDPGVPDSSDGSDGGSYTLMENYTHPVTQSTGRVARQSTWEGQRQTWERLGATRITVEHAGKTYIFLGNAAGASGTHSYY